MPGTTTRQSRQDRVTGWLLRLLCATALLLGCQFAAASHGKPQPIQLEGSRFDLPLGLYLELYEDRGGQYSGKRLPTDAAFMPSHSKAPGLGYSASTLWARFTLHNPTTAWHDLLLRQHYALIDELTLYAVHDDGTVDVTRTGDRHPFDQRPIRQASFLFPIHLRPGETATFYVSYRSSGQINVDLTLYDEGSLISALELEDILKGAYYGGMLVLFLYNLFLFTAIKDRNYLRYVCYIAMYALLQVTYNGIAFEYFWPELPWWNNTSLAVIVCLTLLTMMRFAKHFLETGKRQPLLNKFGRGVEIVSIGLAVLSLVLPYRFIIQPAVVLSLLTVALILTMSIVALRSGFKPARYFLLAWIMLLIGVALAALKSFGLLPHNFITEYGFQIGSFIEIILLSLALADRMERLQEASITDALTDTFNRRHFDACFQKAFDQVKNRNASLSLAILDIDHFKLFNDRYGHEAGDRALVCVAEALNSALRDSDSLFRYGGEEFSALLPNTGEEDAFLVAERMRKTVGELALKGQGITISIGLTTFDGHNYASQHEMFSSADKALYRAKRQGRDRVDHASELDGETDVASALLD